MTASPRSAHTERGRMLYHLNIAAVSYGVLSDRKRGTRRDDLGGLA